MKKQTERGLYRQPRDRKSGRDPGAASTRSDEAESSAKKDGMRLNRYIARAGVCSRRDADLLIAEGKVKLNGAVVSELGTRVLDGDEVVANGKRIVPAHHIYILLNKPSDTITTAEDERGRKTVLDLIAAEDLKGRGLFPVGRLDRHTTGVLLITNDGNLAHRLMHPSYQIEKYYRVRTSAPVTKEKMGRLLKGVDLDDGIALADNAIYIGEKGHRDIAISIHEGRNRQVRRMFEAVGSRIVKLERVRYAGLTTSGIRPGKWRRLSPEEVKKLYRLVKL
jgi:23S rRNA pseudouridine2605 synthase